MSYILRWTNPAVDAGKTDITVPPLSIVSNATPFTFTGKGAANYAQIQQENLIHLLENFANNTAPQHPTVGQTWYDTDATVLKLCTSTVPISWKSIAGVQITEVGEPAPTNPKLGDLWFERTGPLSGYLYVYSGTGRFPLSSTGIGGWNQIWPIPTETALRAEYDEMKALLNTLLFKGTDEFSNVCIGAGAIGRLFTTLTNFQALDTALNAALTTTPDTNIGVASPADIEAQPVSADWDQLLAAARWAVQRLDLPSDMWQDVSDIPFVQDGRQPPASLTSSYAPGSLEPRYPTVNRLNSRRYGQVTMARMYAETMNVLAIAAANKYNVRGVAGNSGTNAEFHPDVAKWTHCRRQGSFTGGSGLVSTIFRWSSNDERDRFIYGGNSIEVVLSHSPSASPSSADAALQTFIGKHNRFRITADKVRALGGVAPYTLAVAPVAVGMNNIIGTAPALPGPTFTEGTVSLTLQGAASTGTLTLNATINTPTGITGTVSIGYLINKDCTVYGATETVLFPAPSNYNPTTDAGSTSAVFINTAVTQRPVANFTASSTSISAGGSVTLTWSGSGSPTSVEWDLDNDGIFEGSGTTYTTTLATAKKYTVRVRATNSGGTDVLTRHAYITVS